MLSSRQGGKTHSQVAAAYRGSLRRDLEIGDSVSRRVKQVTRSVRTVLDLTPPLYLTVHLDMRGLSSLLDVNVALDEREPD